MAVKYHLARGPDVIGYFSKDEILAMYRTGQLLPTDTYFQDASQEWYELPSLIQILMIPDLAAVSKPSPLPEAAKPEKRKNAPRGCVWAMLIVCVLVIIGAVTSTNRSSNQEDGKPTLSTALFYGQELLKKHLKAPATAKFSAPDDSDTFAGQRKDGDFYVGGDVDSQNSFGALIRNKWEGVIHFDPDDKMWTLVWFKLGDDESGPFPKEGE